MDGRGHVIPAARSCIRGRREMGLAAGESSGEQTGGYRRVVVIFFGVRDLGLRRMVLLRILNDGISWEWNCRVC